MIGMGTIVTKSSRIEPGNIYVGSPSKLLKSNNVGLERNNIDNDKLQQLIIKFNNLNHGNELF
jgi:UDP-N-acetylglucosamine acyltransferase